VSKNLQGYSLYSATNVCVLIF